MMDDGTNLVVMFYVSRFSFLRIPIYGFHFIIFDCILHFSVFCRDVDPSYPTLYALCYHLFLAFLFCSLFLCSDEYMYSTFR